MNSEPHGVLRHLRFVFRGTFLVLLSVFIENEPAYALECEKLRLETTKERCFARRGAEAEREMELKVFREEREALREERENSRAAEPGRQWQSATNRSDMTGELGVTAWIESDSTIRLPYFGSVRPLLYLRCYEDTTAIFIQGNNLFFGDFGYGRIEYRIDEGPVRRGEMRSSTDSSALGYWRGREAIPVAKRLSGGTLLRLRVTPVNMDPQTLQFQLAGYDGKMEEVRDACNW